MPVTRRRRALLDLFCGAGGAGVGYQRAGFEVIGVDLHPQPDYPFEFIQDDALSFIRKHGGEFDIIHASPPCQASSALTSGTNDGGRGHVDMIPATRDILDLCGRPYVIENVPHAKLRRHLTLCGEMFDLAVIRHRWFEISGVQVVAPRHRPHRGRVSGWRHGAWHDGPYFGVWGGGGGGKGTTEQWQTAMGIDWTTNRYSIAEAIPPAYSEFLGAQFLEQV